MFTITDQVDPSYLTETLFPLWFSKSDALDDYCARSKTDQKIANLVLFHRSMCRGLTVWNQEDPLLVAKLKGDIQAIAITKKHSKFTVIELMVTNPANLDIPGKQKAFCRGAGKALVRHLSATQRELRCTINPTNETALTFWKGEGFVKSEDEDEETRRYYIRK